MGLMADPGLPLKSAERLATALPDLLENEIDDGVEWVVKADENSLPLDAEEAVELTRNSSTLSEQRRWEYKVYVTSANVTMRRKEGRSRLAPRATSAAPCSNPSNSDRPNPRTLVPYGPPRIPRPAVSVVRLYTP